MSAGAALSRAGRPTASTQRSAGADDRPRQVIVGRAMEARLALTRKASHDPQRTLRSSTPRHDCLRGQSMNDRPRDLSSSKAWLKTAATVAAMVVIYFVIPLNQRDDPLSVAAATT